VIASNMIRALVASICALIQMVVCVNAAGQVAVDAIKETTEVWSFDSSESWQAWWPDSRGPKPFELSPSSDSLTVTIQPTHRHASIPIYSSRIPQDA